MRRWEPSSRITPDEALHHEWLHGCGGGITNTSPSVTSTHHHHQQRHNNPSSRTNVSTMQQQPSSYGNNGGGGGGGGSSSCSSGDSNRSGGGVVERRREVSNAGATLPHTVPNNIGNNTLNNARKQIPLNPESTEEDVYTLYQVKHFALYKHLFYHFLYLNRTYYHNYLLKIIYCLPDLGLYFTYSISYIFIRSIYHCFLSVLEGSRRSQVQFIFDKLSPMKAK